MVRTSLTGLPSRPSLHSGRDGLGAGSRPQQESGVSRRHPLDRDVRRGDTARMRMGRWCVIVAVVVGAVLAQTSSVGAAAFHRCDPAPTLEGRLVAKNLRCSKARSIAFGYFTHTQPGRHTGPAAVGGFRCNGTLGRVFHIACARGSAALRFDGVAA